MQKLGPYEAERQGKTSSEDILTSRVFGGLNRVDSILVLKGLLEKLEIILPEEEMKQAEMRFWGRHRIPNTVAEIEPDVEIETNSMLIFIEAKLDSPIIPDQLRKEYETGKSKKSNFHLISITKHFLKPKEIQQTEFPIKWISWQDLNGYLRGISDLPELDKHSKITVNDICVLLTAKDLRGFAKFEPKQLEQIIKSTGPMRALFKEISIFIKHLTSQLDAVGIERVTMTGSHFSRDGTSRHLDWPESWITTHFTFAFGDKSWNLKDFGGSHLFVRFFLDRKPSIWVGYSWRTYRSKNSEMLENKAQEICDYIKNQTDMSLAFISPWNESNIKAKFDSEDIIPERFREEEINQYYRTEVLYEIPMSKISNPKLLHDVREKLIYLRDMITKLSILPERKEEVETAETTEPPEHEDITKEQVPPKAQAEPFSI